MRIDRHGQPRASSLSIRVALWVSQWPLAVDFLTAESARIENGLNVEGELRPARNPLLPHLARLSIVVESDAAVRYLPFQ